MMTAASFSELVAFSETIDFDRRVSQAPDQP
jgi:hypothetical protein